MNESESEPIQNLFMNTYFVNTKKKFIYKYIRECENFNFQFLIVGYFG